MKFKKKRITTDTVRKIYSDDGSICYGVMGKVRDLIGLGILEKCNYPLSNWCFIINPSYVKLEALFYETKEELLYDISCILESMNNDPV